MFDALMTSEGAIGVHSKNNIFFNGHNGLKRFSCALVIKERDLS